MSLLRVVIILAVITLIGAACTATRNVATSTTEVSQAQDAGTTPTDVRLLTLDLEGAIHVVSVTGDEIETIVAADGSRFTQPIWSTQDTIVATEISSSESYLTSTRVGGDELWRTALSTPPFYYIASGGPDRVSILSLRNNDGSTGLIAETFTENGVVATIGDESPFYMSWSPAGDEFATHVGDRRLDVHTNGIETISSSASMYQAPVWLDDGLVTLRTNGSNTFLSLWSESSFDDLALVRGTARFVGAGSRIAIQAGLGLDTGGIQALAQAIPTIPTGILTVIDTKDVSFTTVTSEASPLYQWDPTGTRLLYATFESDPEPALVWHVWEAGATIDYEPFAPDPQWFQTIAPFFDQYAQSVSLWAPDGTAFTYPALVDGFPRIFVQDIGESSPLQIGDGFWVAFAP
ncbi:MAG: hypothetical protein GWP18_04695 [Proteobacteria bacterium]|nr:hypothetical protein [Pseudomonadota bacterium]